MNSTQENAIRFNLESARDRAQHEADRMRLMLEELVLLWEQGSIAPARSKEALIVKAKFETARKLIDVFKTKIESAYADYLAHGGIGGEALLAKLKRKRAADRKYAEKLLKRLR